MRLRTVLFDLLWLVLLIPVVTVIFRVIPERKVAASVAGVLFVLVPAALMRRRWKNPLPFLPSKSLWWLGVLQFWIFFALPMLSARLMFWNLPFEQFSFFGFTGPEWHELSSKSYALVMVMILLSGLLAGFGREKE